MKKCIGLLLLIFVFGLRVQGQKLVEAIDLGIKTSADVPPAFSFLMQNSVHAYKLVYETPDTKGNMIQASGLAVIPTREGFAFPIAVYQHGTVSVKSEVPSNLSAEAAIGFIFGSNNYIVLLPDLLGFGANEEDVHPFVHKESQATAAINMVFAFKEFAAQGNAAFNDQLFVTGYSQGGHAAASLHYVLQRDYSEELPVTASVPMSGPYSISGEMVDLILREVPYNFPHYLANTFVSYNHVYELYDSSAQLFKQPYAGMVDQFIANEIELRDVGNMMRAQLISDHGATITNRVLHDSIITILNEKNDAHPLIQALKDNDVFDWTPQVPMRLFYCKGDEQIIYTNSTLADSVMNANGAADVASQNFGDNADHGDCVAPALLNGLAFFATFQALVTDVDDIEDPTGFKIYPNPARDWIQLEGINSGAAIEIFNNKGQVIKRARSEGESFKLDIQDMNSGIYWLRVMDGRKVKAKALVIE